MSDDDFEKWDYPPHTKAKHDMLASYLDGWYPILSRWNGRVLFLDGFAGRGRYKNGAIGSPLIALKHLLNHTYFPRMRHREFVFLFVEANPANFESLRYEVDQFMRSHSPWPDNVKVDVRHAAFDETATEILHNLRTQKAKLAPTFAFVDPFGYSGLSINLLADLLAYPRTEIFVNFMVGHVNRFIERRGQQRPMRDLFGIEVDEILSDFSGSDRIAHLRDVYERQLQSRAGFDHVQSFAMKNSTGNTCYYLLHGTRHRLGVKLMKAAMWKIDPGGGYVFSDRLANEDVLFTADPDLRPLREVPLRTHRGRAEILIDDIGWFALLQTPYRETHVRPVLTELEGEGAIRVTRPGKRGFPAGKTRITFN
ncbi:MAG: three-Cys-motif partner protein TcmP [Pseudonocardiaceae bacterium]